MKLAIMQPYIFPYIGYFQLINAVDRFVILDDVNYIKKGWINRNRILVNKKDYKFIVPVKDLSQNKLISDLFLVEEDKWKIKLLRTIEDNYKKAPFYESTFLIINQLIEYGELNLSRYIVKSLQTLTDYLGISTQIIPSSSVYCNSNLKAQERILDICMKEKADVYINAIGGIELYSKEEFHANGIDLKFLSPSRIEYPQFQGQFVPWLSIIDVLMFNPKEVVKTYLNQYDLV
jgi:hypothetical protein